MFYFPDNILATINSKKTLSRIIHDTFQNNDLKWFITIDY